MGRETDYVSRPRLQTSRSGPLSLVKSKLEPGSELYLPVRKQIRVLQHTKCTGVIVVGVRRRQLRRIENVEKLRAELDLEARRTGLFF